MSLDAVRDAATVILVRDRVDGVGIEVFLLRRTSRAAFAGGMYVFPGGAVDLADDAPEYVALCRGLDPESANRRLGVRSGGLAYWVAAIRECAEEAGVLMAATADGAPARLTLDHRDSLNDGSVTLAALCHRDGLELLTDAVEYIAHWITPQGEGRRFDTRFFVACLPRGQQPEHDNSETVASVWLSPTEAVSGCDAGTLPMLPPTRACLEWLTAFSTAGAVMAAAKEIVDPPAILPKVRRGVGATIELVMPGDVGYDELD